MSAQVWAQKRRQQSCFLQSPLSGSGERLPCLEMNIRSYTYISFHEIIYYYLPKVIAEPIDKLTSLRCHSWVSDNYKGSSSHPGIHNHSQNWRYHRRATKKPQERVQYRRKRMKHIHYSTAPQHKNKTKNKQACDFSGALKRFTKADRWYQIPCKLSHS